MTNKGVKNATVADDDDDKGSLFRKQVLEEQRSQWLGKVLIAPSISHSLFAGFAITAAVAVLALLFLGDYTRKEKINGWLVPQQGLVQIFSPLAGVVTQLRVEEGTSVSTGDVLLTVSTELQSEALGATQEEVVRRLQLRRDSLLAEQPLSIALFEQQLRSLDDRIQAAENEQRLRQRELDVQRERVAIATKVAARLGRYRKDGTVSESQWQEEENERLDQLMRERQLQRDISVTQREVTSLKAEMRALPFEHKKVMAAIERSIDSLEQELAEAEARRQFVLTAPQTGTVTALQLEMGGSVKSDRPVMSIIPKGAELEAKLYLPTRAIGFVEVGQQVLLRYRAFPYQKFGHYKGTIAKVSRSTVNYDDLSPQLRGTTDSSTVNQRVYPVTVKLSSQTVNAYGRRIDLQPGMEFEADVLIENRKLIEWVLEPLYTLTGKMSA